MAKIKTNAKAQAAQDKKSAEALAGAYRTTVKTAGGMSEDVVRARLKAELQRAGLEPDAGFDDAVKTIAEGGTPTTGS